MVSEKYLAEHGNNTPFFLIPVAAVAVAAWSFMPLDLFVTHVAALALSFYAHVYLDAQYHVTGCWLGRFRWFRRKQLLHFVHHRHANTNFAVIDFFWARLLGTFRPIGGEDEPERVAALQPTTNRSARQLSRNGWYPARRNLTAFTAEVSEALEPRLQQLAAKNLVLRSRAGSAASLRHGKAAHNLSRCDGPMRSGRRRRIPPTA